ncbi:Acyltransferase family protein [Ruegeria intermedia]|uniref:Acyltransferase family protein n=1 Tax=Ruegeria intermedia TaxID=996115 RepID=A0A1M4U6M1_9RHOB|nr:acyltransferase family protein [Ruegeria intermedia]SHE52335.1 Acyltransferase family protein [Ruegeria intermedia]
MRLCRLKHLDVLLGIGIILVVAGHVLEPPVSSVIYVFYMPLFFFLGGFLAPEEVQVTNAQTALGLARRKAVRVLLPYVSFLVLISLPSIVTAAAQSPEVAMKALLRLAYGGEMLTGWTGVFWFPTTYFLRWLRSSCSVQGVWRGSNWAWCPLRLSWPR